MLHGAFTRCICPPPLSLWLGAASDEWLLLLLCLAHVWPVCFLLSLLSLSPLSLLSLSLSLSLTLLSLPSLSLTHPHMRRQPADLVEFISRTWLY